MPARGIATAITKPFLCQLTFDDVHGIVYAAVIAGVRGKVGTLDDLTHIVIVIIILNHSFSITSTVDTFHLVFVVQFWPNQRSIFCT